MAASLANAKEISVDATIVAVLSDLDGILTLNLLSLSTGFGASQLATGMLACCPLHQQEAANCSYLAQVVTFHVFSSTLHLLPVQMDV